MADAPRWLDESEAARHVGLRQSEFARRVKAGWLVSQHGDQAVLRDSRRLWSWQAKGGIALSGLAVHGLKSGKIDAMLPEIALTGVIETIPCSDVARETINAA